MSDKRSVATDALDTLGTAPLDDTAKRDAIHLAVEPVVAGERMDPGDNITVINGVAWRADEGDDDEPLGIVDPFVKRSIRKGERFWFVMYPRTIRSLRHVWSHPAFADEPVIGASAAQEPQATPTAPTTGIGSKEYSERWLREFIDSANCPNYERVIELIDKGSLPSTDPKYYADGGEYSESFLHFTGRDASGEIPPEFWDHAEIVVGRKLTMRPTYFSCSC